MERRCAKCKKLLGYRKPILNTKVSHGLCRSCIKEDFPEEYEILKLTEDCNCIYKDCYYNTLGKDLGSKCPVDFKANECSIHKNFLMNEELKETDDIERTKK